MNRRIALLVLCGLATPAVAGASEFDEFRIPENRWRRLDAAASGSADLGDGSAGTEASKTSTGNLQFSLARTWGFDSDPARRVFQLAVAANTHRNVRESRRREEYPVLPGLPSLLQDERDSESRGVGERVNGSADVRWHPWSRPLGLAATLSATAMFEQDWSSEERTTLQRADADEMVDAATFGRREDRYYYAVAARVAPGYGRVRNADGVFAARLLEERLIRDGRLAGPLGTATRERLARLFYVEFGYGQAHDLPDRYFWRDVEAALAADPAARSESLDAYSVLHALEPVVVAASGFPRSVGWFVGPAVAGRHLHSIARAEISSSRRITVNGAILFEEYPHGSLRAESSSDEVMVGAIAEYHRPLGLRRQLDAWIEAGSDVRGGGDDVSLQSRVDFRQLVAERWFATLSGGHTRIVREFDGPVGHWQASARARCEYFLEDRWSVGVGLTHSQQRRSFVGGYVPEVFQRVTRVDFSVGYGRGAFEVPGLIDPVLPLH